MFGRGRFQNGVILEPVEGHAFEPDEGEDGLGGKKLEAFRNAVWPYVEQANAFAPTHSRIFKEVCMLLDGAYL